MKFNKSVCIMKLQHSFFFKPEKHELLTNFFSNRKLFSPPCLLFINKCSYSYESYIACLVSWIENHYSLRHQERKRNQNIVHYRVQSSHMLSGTVDQTSICILIFHISLELPNVSMHCLSYCQDFKF